MTTKHADAENIALEVKEDQPYVPDPALYLPKRYLIVVDEQKANESCPMPPAYADQPHKLGRFKIHPYLDKTEPAPDGFIIAPSAQPIEVLAGDYPQVYQILKDQGVAHLPPNG